MHPPLNRSWSKRRARDRRLRHDESHQGQGVLRQAVHLEGGRHADGPGAALRSDRTHDDVMRPRHMTVSRNLRATFGVVLAVVCAVSFADCRRKDEGGFVVGFAQMEHNNPWRLAQTASIKAEAAKRKYDLVVTDAQGQTS